MGHVSRGELLQILGSNNACGLDEAEIVDHVAGCSRCWRLARGAFAELKSLGARVPMGTEPVRSLHSLVASQEERSVARLGAQGRLAKLKRLTPAKRLELIRTTAVYRTPAMVHALLRETEELARSRSEEAEELGRLTLALLELLSSETCLDPRKNDLRAAVWIEMANGRRIRTDWNGAHQALKQAGNLLRTGTGNLQPRARLHSIRSSLAFDTGQTSLAVQAAGLAQGIYRELEDWSGLAKTILQEADALVEVDPTRALRLSEEGIKVTTDSEIRLRMHLKCVATDCLIELGRAGEALSKLEECRPYFDQFRNEIWVRLRVRATEARLLEVLGRFQEAELLYREVIEDAIEEGFTKEGFMWRLMLFNFYVMRDRLEEALALCSESARALEEAGAHEQMREVWRDLGAFVQARRVDENLIRILRLYMAHHWRVPAKRSPFTEGWEGSMNQGFAAPQPVAAPMPQARPPASPAPPTPATPQPVKPLELGEDGLRETVEDFEGRLISAALDQCGGRIRETARQLRISRNTLKEKMKRYGLRGVD